VFASYLLEGFLDAGLYLSAPASASVLAAGTGDIAGAGARGFGWLLLRWLGDQAAGDERAFFRRLASGGRDADRGIRNLERATGRSWDALLADVSAALILDGSGVEAGEDRLRLLSWDLHDVLAGLVASPDNRAASGAAFSLEPTTLAPETATVAFDVGASTIRYFALRIGPDSPALALGVQTPAGTRVSESSEPQITIVRIQ
jgi:hypothetical protein